MQVYADNAATTRMSDRAVQAMLPLLQENFGNPSSLHSVGQRAKEALENARDSIAADLGVSPKEIYFTSGGSEADNQAIRSAAAMGGVRARPRSFLPPLSTTRCCTLWRRWRKRASP